MKKQVICINWGDRYGAPYINRLYGMVARNLTPPFEFVCFTDTRRDVRPEVRCEDLPPLEVAMPTGTFGKWPKSRIWSPTLADLSGPVLFMDLDLVIIGSLDPFFAYGDPDDVILSRNPTRPLERLGQTSLFRFPVGKLAPLLETFKADPQGVADEYQWEQRFVTRNAPGGVKFWPKPWVRLFRRDCTRPFPLNFFLPPKAPRDARVILFPGVLLPSHAIEGRWDERVEAMPPMEHIRTAFAKPYSRRPFRHIRHYLRPADWVGAHWRE